MTKRDEGEEEAHMLFAMPGNASSLSPHSHVTDSRSTYAPASRTSVVVLPQDPHLSFIVKSRPRRISNARRLFRAAKWAVP